MDPQIIPQQNISLSGISGGGEIDIYTYFTASPYFAGFDNYDGSERKIFLSSFRSFSPSLREFLSSDTTASTIFTVGQSYDLGDDQIFILAKSVRELVTGSLFIKDFPITLSSKLGIDDIKAGEIANKIVSGSFGPILEDFKRIQRSKFPDKISQLQKESVPEKMTQPTARPVTPREAPTPAQALQQKMADTEPRQAPLPKPPILPPRAETKPQDILPILSPKNEETQNRGSSIANQNFSNSEAIGTKPFVPVFKSPVQEEMSNKTLTQPQVQSRPEFKIPDLGQTVTPEKAKEFKEANKNTPNKNLEEELEKIANVIDLRSQEK